MAGEGKPVPGVARPGAWAVAGAWHVLNAALDVLNGSGRFARGARARGGPEVQVPLEATRRRPLALGAILDFVPGTAGFERRHQAEIDADVQARLAAVHRFFVDARPVEAQRLEDLVREHARPAVLRSATVATFAGASTVVVALLLLLGLLAVPSVRGESGPGELIMALVGVWLSFFGYLSAFASLVRHNVPAAVLLPASLAGGVLAVWLALGLVNQADDSNAVALGLLVVVGWLLILGATATLASLLITIGATAALTRWRYPLAPEAEIFHTLFRGYLAAIEPQAWLRGSTKRALMQHLESAARSFEADLPSALRSGDVTTEAWFRMRAAEIAAAVRQLKMWVLTPMADSQDHFLEQLGGMLSHFIDGDWDALPRERVAAVPPRQRVASYAARVWSVVIGGVLPVALVLWLQRAELLTGPAAATVPLAAFAFAILTVMTNFDPNFQATFSVLKDVAPWLGLDSKAKSSSGTPTAKQS